MTVDTKLSKMCLSNIFIDDEIFKRLKTIPVAILFVNISLATVTSFGKPRVMGAIESLGSNWWKNMHQIDA